MKSRALMFWLALLMIFAGAMTIMYASGRIGGRRELVPGTQAGGAPLDDGTKTLSEQIAVQAKSKEKPTLEISEFELTDQLGRKFHSDQLLGKIWVGSIFFSKCPSTCRMQNAEVAKLQSEFGKDGVQFVSITCDPKNDDVVTLSAYARMFNANPEQWFFLTGPYETAEKIGNTMFGITVQPETHSDRLVLINREGKVHSTHRSMLFEDTKKIRQEIRSLLMGEDVQSASGAEAENEANFDSEPKSNEFRADESVQTLEATSQGPQSVK